MKKYFIYFTWILLFNSSDILAQAQNVDPNRLLEGGYIRAAIEAYAKSYQLYPENRQNTYDYASALALNQQIDSAFHYLKIATQKDNSIYPLTDPDFYYLIDDPRWQAFQTDLIQKTEEKHGKFKNLSLSKQLWELSLKDQAFYYHLQVADKAVSKSSPLYFALWTLKHKINAENQAALASIVAKNGWPKESKVGRHAANGAFLVVQHADFEYQQTYLAKLQKAAEKGEAEEKAALALFIDRINLQSGKKQVYGSQIGTHPETDEKYVLPLENPDKVDERRKSMNLPPLNNYTNRFGFNWDAKAYKKALPEYLKILKESKQ